MMKGTSKEEADSSNTYRVENLGLLKRVMRKAIFHVLKSELPAKWSFRLDCVA
jgi:hypothetical protein